MDGTSDRLHPLKLHLISRLPFTSSVTRRHLVRRAVHGLLHVYFRLRHGLEVQGLENVPAQGPAMIVANHASYLDVVVGAAVLPPERFTFLALSTLFHFPLIGTFVRTWDGIPVSRNGRDLGALRRATDALARGRLLGVAVEGARSPSGRLGEVNQVLAKFAVKSGVAVIPMGIGGTNTVLPYGAAFPRGTKITVRFGPAIDLPPGTPGPVAQDAIRYAIAGLLPPDQRPEEREGTYAST